VLLSLGWALRVCCCGSHMPEIIVVGSCKFRSKLLAMEAATQNAAHSESSNSSNIAAQRWSVALLALNFVGAVVYVVSASRAWAIPQERELGLHSVTGEPFVWALSVFPVCAVFLVLNLMWGVFILDRKRWRSGIFWLLTIPIWVASMVIDFAHH
jgi:hypothetical protein